MLLCRIAAFCAAGLMLGNVCRAEEKRIVPMQEENMEKTFQFLKDAGYYFLATAEGDQPRVRPFGTVHVYEGKLYVQTGKRKDVSRQIAKNPKVELCAFKDGKWIRVCGTLVNDDRREAKVAMLDAYPSLKKLYDPDDGNTQVLYLEHATVRLYSSPVEFERWDF